MERKKVKQVLCELGLFVLQMIFSRVNLFCVLDGAGLAFAFVRVFFGSNILLVSFEYLLSKIAFPFVINKFFVVAYQIILLALYYLIKEYVKLRKEFLLMSLMGVIANVLELYFSFSTLETFLSWLAGFAWFLILLIYFYFLFRTFKRKLIFFRFGRGDYFMFSVFVALVSCGIFSVVFIEKFLAIFLLAFLGLFFSKIFLTDKYFIFYSIMALSLSLISGNYKYLVLALIILIVMVELKEYSKWLQSVASLFVFAGLCFGLKMYSIFNIASFALAVVIFAIFPAKWINQISHIFELNSFNLIYRYIDEQKNLEIRNKLSLMSSTLLRMKNDFKFLMVGKIDRVKASECLAGDVVSKCCSNCENYRFCFMENINKRQMFENLMSKAIQNGNVSETDMLNGIQAYCSKNAIVMSEINQIAELYLKFESKMKNEDSSKLLIANELGNFADIFSNFAKIINKSLKINEKTSKILKESFLNAMIDVKEVVVLENDEGIESINIVASNEQVLRREIVAILSKVTKNEVCSKTIKHLEISGLSLITFVPVSKIKAHFAVSSKAKEESNGDNAVITKLSENKYFVAIADGMGHGENARRISSMVLSLIKSMFEVGLDNGLIIESVNKLLIPAGLDNFTTLDACVLDLDAGVGTFIKLGSSVSVIKHKNTSEVIASESLPIGIVQNIKPTIIRKPIFAGDVIFLASDGVVDSFPSIDSYKCFVNDAKIFNLQKFLDDVIFDSESQNLKHADDMTIIGINLLKN